MASVEQVMQRKDGSEVKVVAQAFFGSGLTCSIGVHVLHRANPESAWNLASDRPHPDWRNMSVDEYVKRGRSEMLRVASIGEMLRATTALRANLQM